MNWLNLLEHLPDMKKLSHNIRSTVISISWKVFHIILSWWDKSLEKTSKLYVEKTNTNISIDNCSNKAIENLKRLWKWIIISNHKSGNFSDYLPLFATLGDDILKKSIFYTGAYNLAMNKREFPEYEFRAATLKNRKDIIRLMKQIKNDIEKINDIWWYIFIIPSWEGTSDDTEFKAIFQKMIKWSDDNMPVLANYVKHNYSRWYKQIAESIIRWINSNITISSQLQSVKNWKDSNWKAMKWYKMREKYNKDFNML